MQEIDSKRPRSTVPVAERWNVEAMYLGWDSWRGDFSKAAMPQRFASLKESLYDFNDPQSVKKLLDSVMEIESELDYLHTYAQLRHDEDVTEDTAKSALSEITGLCHQLREQTCWIEPKLLQLSQERLDGLLASEVLQEYQIYLKKIIRLKPYTLSFREEQILAFAGKSLQVSGKAFGAFNNGDLQFPDCTDAQGRVHKLTHGSYHLHLRSEDRTLRKNAFTTLHQEYAKWENTLCELLQGLAEKHVFHQKVRGYASCLDAALYPHQIEKEVYLQLLRTAKEGSASLHRYISLRKKALGYEQMYAYDLAVPLVKDIDLHFSYESAVAEIVDSLAPLGEEYQKVVRAALLEDRWVDRYENDKKRSGGYSGGCYKSIPYILMNYHGALQDVMTLTHEIGHSMHSYLSRKHQKYQDYQYPIFLAEVASTFHEELLFRHFLRKAESKELKAYYINQKIDGIRVTFFRQVLFAEFELRLHEWAERNEPITPAVLREEYQKLSKELFGEDLVVDEELAIEWARIPHFYYNFYVYQYATGISAAYALVEKVLQGGQEARDRYLQFLSGGGSQEPLEALLQAGVDMRSPDSTKALLSYFDKMVQELSAF